jgi:hypothetical protein
MWGFDMHCKACAGAWSELAAPQMFRCDQLTPGCSTVFTVRRVVQWMLLLSFCVVQVLHVKPSEAWLAAFDAASLQHMADFTPQGLADILAAQVKRAGGPREGGGVQGKLW